MFRSILWFRQDLRLHDNEALLDAIRNSDELMPVFIFSPKQFIQNTQYGTPKTGVVRTRFLLESITDLRRHLRSIGSDLIIRIGSPEQILYEFSSTYKIHWVYCNRERTREEVTVQDKLEQNLWTIGNEVRYSRGKMLFHTADLPFPITHCPDTFTNFRKETEQMVPVRLPLLSPHELPPLPAGIEPGQIPDIEDLIPVGQQPHIHYFKGGETEGLKALSQYGIDDPPSFMANEGSLLSPWLSMGCLSPKKVYHEAYKLKNWTAEVQQYLLYRDYLRLMGKKYGDRIFYKSGIRNISVRIKKDASDLVRWEKGETGIGIIDSAMHQLNQSGWLSESLRRLVSSYYLKVLNLDWRLGAAYFESKLIDYDPCSNWVSWLNQAGLGPESREDRTLNYDAVGKKMDPQNEYILAWQ